VRTTILVAIVVVASAGLAIGAESTWHNTPANQFVISSFGVESRYTGPSTVWAGATAIGFRVTGAPGPLGPPPLTVSPGTNLTVLWSVSCGGNSSFSCSVTSVTVDAPFLLSYNPTHSNTPWVWTGIGGGSSDVFEEIYVTGPSTAGSYSLVATVSVTESSAGS